jgi:predicted DNA-binding transcriptional regulator YafY
MPTGKVHNSLARQWELLSRLPPKGPGKTATELTQELNEAGFKVSKRTVERDLGDLLEAFPLNCRNRNAPYG